MYTIIVLAGNKQQFDYYLRQIKLHPDVAVVYGEAEKIQGLEADEVVTCGTFWDRVDAFQLERLAKSRLRKPSAKTSPGLF